VYQVGNNKKVILWFTANQISRTEVKCLKVISEVCSNAAAGRGWLIAGINCQCYRRQDEHSILLLTGQTELCLPTLRTLGRRLRIQRTNFHVKIAVRIRLLMLYVKVHRTYVETVRTTVWIEVYQSYLFIYHSIHK